GATVVKLPTQNYNYSLDERIKMASGHDPNLFISIHSNSSKYDTSAKGTEAYYFNPFSYAFSQFAAQNVSKSLGTINRGGKFGYFYVTRSMQYPTILVECGFLTNPEEYNKLIDSDYQTAIAKGIANSMGSYLSLMGKDVDMVTGTQTSGSMNSGANIVASPTDDANEEEAEIPPTSNGKAKLTLSDSKITIDVDESISLIAEVENGKTSDIVWKVEKNDAVDTSSDKDSPDVLSIRGVDLGTVKIVAYLKNQSSAMATCMVTVK
ncbi:MAG: N-acetylmuramoyl-L-alanine amidase, partial [Oscillospiraceae bacterium]